MYNRFQKASPTNQRPRSANRNQSGKRLMWGGGSGGVRHCVEFSMVSRNSWSGYTTTMGPRHLPHYRCQLHFINIHIYCIVVYSIGGVRIEPGSLIHGHREATAKLKTIWCIHAFIFQVFVYYVVYLSGVFFIIWSFFHVFYIYYVVFLSGVLSIMGLSFTVGVFVFQMFCLSDGLSIMYDLSIVWNVHQMVSISGGQSIRWSFLRIHKGLLFVYQSAINASNLFLFSLKQIFVAKTHVFVSFPLLIIQNKKIQYKRTL